MKNSLCTVALLAWILRGIALAEDARPDLPPLPTAAPAGSIQPWNGHDLSGWTVFLKDNAQPPPDFWKANDGVLAFIGKVSGYVRTEKAFSNYHLHVEYRWPEKAANSGVFVHERAPDAIWPCSVQVNFKVSAVGDLIPQGGFTFDGKTDTAKKLAEPNEKPVGEWNGCDIFCRADSIEVFVNGVRQNFVEKLSANAGQIALQLEGTAIEFRNLWLRDLPKP
ncbi:MAG: hypothetical protein QOD99_2993 [Chthoniobacter sp.]|jgi:hypothetical protein|nr:hypothetical protein [Chthoniobacter sp.]